MLSKLFANHKLNKKGFTLVELICAIALLAIVGLSVAGFIMMSTRTYGTAAEQVDVQYEAQQALNQIKEMVLDANRGVNMYTTYKDDATDEIRTLANPYFAIFNQEEYVKDDGSTGYRYPVVKILYDSTTNSLYYGQKTFDAVTAINVTDAVAFPATSLLAKNVSYFNVDTSLIDKNQVTITAKFISGSASIDLSPVVSLRNKVIASPNLDSIYDNTPIERVGYVTNVFIERVDGTVLSSNSDTIIKSNSSDTTVSYKANVDSWGMSTAVEWILEDASQDVDGNYLSYVTDGVVTIKPGESSSILKLTARSVAMPTKSCTITIAVHDYDPDLGYVNTLTMLNGATDSGGNGYKEYTFSAELTYLNEDKVAAPTDLRGCTWTVEAKDGGSLDGVTIQSQTNTDTDSSNNTGLSTMTLHCTSEAANKNLVIKATSKAKDINGNNITVLYNSGEFPVENISDPTPTNRINVNFNTPSRSYSRNTSGNSIGVTVSNATNVTIKWRIKALEGFSSEDSTVIDNISLSKPETSYVNTDRRGRVYYDDNYNKNYFSVNGNLNVTKDFKFTYVVTVSGRVNGEWVDSEEFECPYEFVIPAVEISIKRSGNPRYFSCNRDRNSEWYEVYFYGNLSVDVKYYDNPPLYYECYFNNDTNKRPSSDKYTLNYDRSGNLYLYVDYYKCDYVVSKLSLVISVNYEEGNYKDSNVLTWNR